MTFMGELLGALRKVIPFREPTLVHHQRESDRGKVINLKAYGERSGIDGSTHQIPRELRICREMARVLHESFRGHPWKVEVNLDQGVATLGIPPLLGNWVHVFHLDGDMSDKAIRDAAGDILVRFGIPRSTVDFDAYLQAEKDTPMIGQYRGGHRALIPS
jgi:hypothetical protein